MVIKGQFEPAFPEVGESPPNTFYYGEMDIEITDLADVPSGFILPVDTDWQLTVNWHVKGSNVGRTHGEWIVTAYLECLGLGPDGLILNASVPMVIEPNREQWYPLPPKSFIIGPINGTPESKEFYDAIKTLAQTEPEKAYGAYKLVVVLTAKDETSSPWPLAGYVDGPVLQLYKRQ